MSLLIDIVHAPDIGTDLPGRAELSNWLGAAWQGREEQAELSVRIVGAEEGRRLNQKYRGRDYATNVLSFPADVLPGLSPRLLGDLVICAPVVAREAAEQQKLVNAHWAHLCVHGVLHLLGYDHEIEGEARTMEGLEVEILQRLGYQDPYRADA